MYGRSVFVMTVAGAALGGNADEVVAEVLRPGAAAGGSAGAARRDDGAPVRRPDRMDVLRGGVGEAGGSAAGRRDRQEVPFGVVPGGVSDRCSVGRERR